MEFDKVVIARQAITDKHGTSKPESTIVDSIACPVCKTGVLDYQISSHNGHIAARCDSRTCVNWME